MDIPSGYTVDEHVTGQWSFSCLGVADAARYDSREDAIAAAWAHSSTIQ